jgi:hypothetical protein
MCTFQADWPATERRRVFSLSAGTTSRLERLGVWPMPSLRPPTPSASAQIARLGSRRGGLFALRPSAFTRHPLRAIHDHPLIKGTLGETNWFANRRGSQRPRPDIVGAPAAAVNGAVSSNVPPCVQSASALFSTSVRRFIMSSVIGGPSRNGLVSTTRPTGKRR